MKDECAFCKEKGHWKKDCPKLKNKEKMNANLLHAEDDEIEFVLATTVSTFTNEWILNSTCYYHMCPYRDCFTSLDAMSSGTVLI